MKPSAPGSLYRLFIAAISVLLTAKAQTAMARVGGAGGHGGGSFGHSGGSHSYGGGGGGLYFLDSPVVIIIIVLYILYTLYTKSQKKNEAPEGEAYVPQSVPLPPGLDQNKIAGSFVAIQQAWQNKDLTNVRKWLSDGMYQKLTTQFKMMNLLQQRNTLSNIRINSITATNTYTDGHYQVADVAISFTMDDSFTSNKFPQFNEAYQAESDTEYWTFIKRTDSTNEKNLYDNQNCPNCGAPFEVKMGEISRCSHCNTLTNSAAYDWVLSEITQAAEYTGDNSLSMEDRLKDLMKNDPFFSVQRMEDIASNVFMQVMEVLTGDDDKKLSRFADDQVAAMLIESKQATPHFVFDRLYINNISLTNYTADDLVVKFHFDLQATFRRATLSPRLQMLDADFITRPCSIELSRNRKVLNGTAGETVYSHECSSCGAPYTDTTEDKCTYCGAPVIDKQRNWVLTGFVWG